MSIEMNAFNEIIDVKLQVFKPSEHAFKSRALHISSAEFG